MNRLYLLADDDHDDAELFAEALAVLSPPVDAIHVEDGLQVFRYLSDKRNPLPDIIFLDVNMPEMDGWQCLAGLKNDIYFKDLPVIMYSTSSLQRDRERAIRLGALDFVTKPSEYRALIKLLKEISEQAFSNKAAH